MATEKLYGLLRIRFVRFLLVGGMNTGFSYGIYAALLYCGLPYLVANLAALLMGILFSFRTQGRLVFGNPKGRLIFRFAACWGVIWLLNILVISVLMHTGLNAYWAGALALLPTTLLSYIVQKVFVFRAPPANATNSLI